MLYTTIRTHQMPLSLKTRRKKKVKFQKFSELSPATSFVQTTYSSCKGKIMLSIHSSRW